MEFIGLKSSFFVLIYIIECRGEKKIEKSIKLEKKIKKTES